MSSSKTSPAEEVARLAVEPRPAPRRSSATLELARRIYVELVRTDAYKLGTEGYEGGSLTEMAEAALDAAEVFEACAAKEDSE